MGHEILTAREGKHGNERMGEGAARSLFEDAYGESFKTIGSVARVTAMAAGGTVAGAVDEIVKDPPGALCRAGAVIAGGVGVGVLAAASPALAATIGTTMTGAWAWENLNPYNDTNSKRYSKLGDAVRETWSRDDARTFNKNLNTVRESTGPIALDVGLMALSPQVIKFSAKHTKNFVGITFAKSELLPAAGCYPTESLRIPKPSTAFSAEDINFFATKHGEVRISKGPPSTIEARLAEMDKAQGIKRNAEQPKPIQEDHLVFSDLWEVVNRPLADIRKHEPQSSWYRDRYGVCHP